MTLEVVDGAAKLSGTCTVEEAEALHSYLRTADAAQLDLSQCAYLHTALLQLLLRERPQMTGGASAHGAGRVVEMLLSHSNSEWISLVEPLPGRNGEFLKEE